MLLLSSALFSTLSKGKKGDYGILSSHSLSVQRKFYGHHSSVTMGPIHSKLGGHLTKGSHGCAQGRNKRSKKLADAITHQTQGRFTPNEFLWNRLCLKIATSWSFAHRGHRGMPTGAIKAPGNLRMPEHSNHWVDSHQIHFVGGVLSCRCATPR